eukprot:scaffold2564_cov65-Phaeocystis_antarctica.AAC.4
MSRVPLPSASYSCRTAEAPAASHLPRPCRSPACQPPLYEEPSQYVCRPCPARLSPFHVPLYTSGGEPSIDALPLPVVHGTSHRHHLALAAPPSVLPLTVVNVTAGVYAHALALPLGVHELPFVEVSIWAQLRADALAFATHDTRLAVLRSVRRGQHPAMPAELALVYLARSVHALALASELRLDKGAFDP